jgi:hypothetical protein
MKKVCGVFMGTVGVKLGASLVKRTHVNMGTTPGLPFPHRTPARVAGR